MDYLVNNDSHFVNLLKALTVYFVMALGCSFVKTFTASESLAVLYFRKYLPLSFANLYKWDKYIRDLFSPQSPFLQSGYRRPHRCFCLCVPASVPNMVKCCNVVGLTLIFRSVVTKSVTYILCFFFCCCCLGPPTIVIYASVARLFSFLVFYSSCNNSIITIYT